MLVGEGPGQKEDEIGKPFMGDAGKLLNKMLAAIDIKKEKVSTSQMLSITGHQIIESQQLLR